MKESFRRILGGNTPLFPILLPESLDETGVVVKLQVCPQRDGASELRHSYFIVRVVVLFFKLLESLWLAEQN